jgi:hypothetical protein
VGPTAGLNMAAERKISDLVRSSSPSCALSVANDDGAGGDDDDDRSGIGLKSR